MSLTHLLFTCLRWPPLNSSAAGARSLQLIRALSPLQRLSLLSFSSTRDQAILELLRAPAQHFPSGLQRLDFMQLQPPSFGASSQETQLAQPVAVTRTSTFEAFTYKEPASIADLQKLMMGSLVPQVILHDTFLAEEAFGWQLRAAFPSALHIVDSQDFHGLRTLRQERLREGMHKLLRRQAEGAGKDIRSGGVESGSTAAEQQQAVGYLARKWPRHPPQESCWQAASPAFQLDAVEDAHFDAKASLHPLQKASLPAAVAPPAAATAPPPPPLNLLPSDIPELEAGILRELASFLRSDVTLFISEEDRQAALQLLQEDGGGMRQEDGVSQLLQRKALVTPFLLQQEDVLQEAGQLDKQEGVQDVRAGPAARQHFVMLGSFQHGPNTDSLMVARRLWPALRARTLQLLQEEQAASRSDAGAPLCPPELHLYGGGGHTAWLNFSSAVAAEGNGLQLKGRMADLTSLRSYRVMLAPLRYGAGLKGKFMDALVYGGGLPVITTPVAAEGYGHTRVAVSKGEAGSAEVVVLQRGAEADASSLSPSSSSSSSLSPQQLHLGPFLLVPSSAAAVSSSSAASPATAAAVGEEGVQAQHPLSSPAALCKLTAAEQQYVETAAQCYVRGLLLQETRQEGGEPALDSKGVHVNVSELERQRLRAAALHRAAATSSAAAKDLSERVQQMLLQHSKQGAGGPAKEGNSPLQRLLQLQAHQLSLFRSKYIVLKEEVRRKEEES